MINAFLKLLQLGAKLSVLFSVYYTSDTHDYSVYFQGPFALFRNKVLINYEPSAALLFTGPNVMWCVTMCPIYSLLCFSYQRKATLLFPKTINTVNEINMITN